MKNTIRRIFVELYHWQNNNWGKAQLPAFKALLLLSGLQILNFGTALLLFDHITSLDLAVYLSSHAIVGMMIPAALLIMDYLLVAPVSETLKKHSLGKRRITWIYVLATILLLASSIAWVIYRNERGA